ncbi:MAG: ABC transporter substrate-binding protein [Geminicoccaceae bacterium]|nr:ABC transporter substrate-binding protein [Geminicoccaceae bacterium]MDW8123302.1 ABC transporter substrate-binding protein [Geminicoccaceae bacterium]MDW8340397.1 ABC transporter substrate-binding protein [Geminicoccaceae bacterium]
MRLRFLTAMYAGAAALAVLAGSASAAETIYYPSLVYRSGPYAPNGIPFANGVADYVAMINARDGGVGGVKIEFEECETGYATDRGVECYERLKGKGAKGAIAFSPLSTGITFALTEKVAVDKIPLQTMGYGRSESADGRVFTWNFPLLGTYWSAADILIQHVNKIAGGLQGKKITLVYHDSPYGKEPIPVLQEHAQRYGYTFEAIPVTHPGVEQKAAWLKIRQTRPDFVFLWGWGVMNSTAIKEAVAVGYPRERMYGVWWAAAEPDVRPAGDDAKGYQGLALHPAGADYPVHKDILKYVYDAGKGAGKREEVGEVLYNRGMIDAMLKLEAVRNAQKIFNVKVPTGEQVREGYERLELTAQRIKELGFEGLITPIKVSCRDHEGSRKARIHQWDGKKWVFVSDWIEANNEYLRPKVEAAAMAYAKEKGITPRTCN